MMQPINKLVIFVQILYVILQHYTGPSADGLPIVRFASAHFLSDLPDFMQLNRFLSPSTDNSDGTSAFNDELEAQRKLAKLLESTREELVRAPHEFSPSQEQCVAFNKTLSEAARELNNLIGLVTNVEAGEISKSRQLLHEDAVEMHNLQALNAYEALGFAVSLYFECVAQLGHLGNSDQLNNLLPISLNMGSLKGVVARAAQSADEGVKFASAMIPNTSGGDVLVRTQVSIDACLSHGLKRRALGLFKTNSSTALVQKIAKSCASAQEVLNMVALEERRQAEELKLMKKQAEQQASSAQASNTAATRNQHAHTSSAKQKVASNLSVHRRNLWIKCALLEKKLVAIVEHLAENASKYYEPEALMANCLSAQLLCSLLVGPCALEFSRSKTNDYYQFEEPSADELLKRHKLSNPIACLCPHQNLNSPAMASSPPAHERQASHGAQNGRTNHTSLARSATDNNGGDQSMNSSKRRSRRATTSQAQMSACNRGEGAGGVASESHCFDKSHSHTATKQRANSENLCDETLNRSGSPTGANSLVRKDSRRRPLALKNNFKSGALVTECHHYCCQEISEHQQTRGYSFKSTSSNGRAATADCSQMQCNNSLAVQRHSSSTGSYATSPNCTADSNCLPQASAEGCWSIWSPRMLHETLHQNSKSNLLYAKNNVQLETRAHGTMAGYLSLHQTSTDLILNWIPNELINGGQQQQPRGGPREPASSSASVELASANSASRSKANEHKRDEGLAVGGGGGQRAHSLDNAASKLGRKSSADGMSSQRARRLSSNVTDLREEGQPELAHDCATANGGRLVQSQAAVGGSHLDLVVSMSVSRIVLLHCLFNGQRRQSEEAEKHQQQQCEDVNPHALVDASSEETLILVEADGVQRAPFRFPKGGLEWFLSCLESGLGPGKHLEPAIKLDVQGGQDDDQDRDPLQAIHSSGGSNGNLWQDSPSASSEPGASRLDVLLRRLPSLRRRSNDRSKSSEGVVSASGSRVTSPTPPGEQHSRQTPFNYVYRIVSSHQTEWPLQTPPHSAFSVASSLSGSFVPASGNGGGGGDSAKSTSKQLSDPTDGQKFRWSLSRLARFSSRGGSTSTNSSTGNTNLAQQASSDGSLVSLNAHHNQQSTVETLSSFGESIDQARNQASASSTSATATDSQVPTATSIIKRDSSSELIRIESKLSDLKKTSGDELRALRDQSIQTLCETMRKQILARAFYGWLAYCRRRKIIRTHLMKLIRHAQGGALATMTDEPGDIEEAREGLTWARWRDIVALAANAGSEPSNELEQQMHLLVYYGGIEDNKLRVEVWPYLLGHYKLSESRATLETKDSAGRLAYEACAKQWLKIERTIKRRDNEILAANMAKVARRQAAEGGDARIGYTPSDASDDFASLERDLEASELDELEGEVVGAVEELDEVETMEGSAGDDSLPSDGRQGSESDIVKQAAGKQAASSPPRRRKRRQFRLESTGSVGSDASITDQFGNNIHRIDKDVQRCDRNFWYFKEAVNLDKLRNIMCSYVWQHLDVGYVQGMCDLAAPFLVIFDDEIKAYHCFNQLMKRMVSNFPHGSAMDQHFENLKYLMQVLDPKLFEVLQNNGDYTHFYFCYRWLLLDFKRELAYEDVYRVWETIWSARHVATDHFAVFLALAMVRYYRDIIIENNMDFTNTIKFFNEMAERHDVKSIISLAQDSIVELGALIRE